MLSFGTSAGDYVSSADLLAVQLAGIGARSEVREQGDGAAEGVSSEHIELHCGVTRRLEHLRAVIVRVKVAANGHAHVEVT